MDATDPPALPELPADLDDLVALDNWYEACNKWISDEASKRNWSWFKPLTPALLHEIVENEKRRRASAGAVESTDGLAAAQSDPDGRREREEARVALNELEQRLIAQDSAYRAKLDLLLPILKPIFKNLPPPQWESIFLEAYKAVRFSPAVPIPPAVDVPKADTLNARTSTDPLRDAEKELIRTHRARLTLVVIIKLVVTVGTLLLMAWFLSQAVQGLSFRPALIAIPLGAILFSTVGRVVDELLWRGMERSLEVDRLLWYFRTNNFPKERAIQSDDIGDYFHWVRNNGATTEIRIAAAGIRYDTFVERRKRAELKKALDIYAPRQQKV